MINPHNQKNMRQHRALAQRRQQLARYKAGDFENVKAKTEQGDTDNEAAIAHAEMDIRNLESKLQLAPVLQEDA